MNYHLCSLSWYLPEMLLSVNVLVVILGKLSLKSRSSKLIWCWYLPLEGCWKKKTKREKKSPLIHEGSKKLKELMAGSAVLGTAGTTHCWSSWAGVRSCVTHARYWMGPALPEIDSCTTSSLCSRGKGTVHFWWNCPTSQPALNHPWKPCFPQLAATCCKSNDLQC